MMPNVLPKTMATVLFLACLDSRGTPGPSVGVGSGAPPPLGLVCEWLGDPELDVGVDPGRVLAIVVEAGGGENVVAKAPVDTSKQSIPIPSPPDIP
jgi:hypothetical protein